MHNKTTQPSQGSVERRNFNRQPPWTQGVLASAVALAMLGIGVDAQALALGAITVRSALGEPLRAEIEVPQISSEEATSLQAAVGTPEAFRAAGVDYTPALAGARVTLHRRTSGQAFLRVVGERPVNEPFLGIVIEANWANGRVVRDYTMLVDPPGRAAPSPVTVTQPQVPTAAPAAPPAVARAPSTASTAPTPESSAAARPRRALPPPAEAAPRRPAPSSEGAQVTVQRGDTASRIASAHAIDGVSLDQMLIALLRANPSAFIGGNVNRMKAGAVLSLPTTEQADATSRQEARRAVVAQTRDFNAYRQGLAQRSGSTRVAAATRSASGGVQAQVQESRTQAPGQDRLTLSRGSDSARTESQVAQSRQAQEQTERVAELNKNISELARLQTASGSAPAVGIGVPTGAPATAASAPAAAPAAAAPQVAASAPESATAAAPSPVASAASQAAPAAASAAASAPKPARAAPPPVPVAEPSFLDSLMEDPLLPVAGAGLLALLAGFGIYRARQRKKAASPDSSFIESRLQPDSFFGASGGQRVDTGEGNAPATGGSSMVYSPSQLDAAGDVDPVAEADVYLAYGRDMQAEEILKESLRTHPDRIAIHRKLAEIYAKRRDARALEAIATEAYGLVKGEGPDWQALTDLGKELDPDNALYQPGGVPTARGPAPAPARRSFGADTEPQTAQLQDRLESVPTSAPVDLELDISDLPELPESTPPAAPRPPVAEPAVVSGAIAAAAAGTAAIPAAPSVAAGTALDFDLDLPFAPPPPSDSPTPAPLPLASEPKRPAVVPPASQATSLAVPPPPVSADHAGMINFDMEALSVDPDSRSGGELKTEQPEDADDDPLETKLALAQEFHVIGDTEGARTLVKEVIAEASGALRVRAERFLTELG